MSEGSDEKKQLGRILLKQKLVTPTQLEDLLTRQRSTPGKRLASTAAEVGSVDQVRLLKALSEQHGIPGIDLSQVVIPLTNLELIPLDIAQQHMILPIVVKEDRIFLAMADPNDRRVIDEIEFVSGRRVFPYVALQDSVSKTIEDVYRRRDAGEAYYIGPHVPAGYLESLGLDPAAFGASAEMPLDPDRDAIELSADDVLDADAALDGEISFDGDAAEADVIDVDEAELDPAFGSRVEPLPEPPKRERRETTTILVVDDEDDIRKLLCRVLQQKGYQVNEAATGSAALTAVRESVPDLIVLDAMLPEVHGFDICRRIKGSELYGHIPIIMVSAIYRGWRMAEDLRVSYGVAAFLEKPFKIADVVNHVERALGGRSDGETGCEEANQSQRALEEAMAHYHQGELDAAISKLQRALKVDPLSFQLHYHLGLLCGRKDQVFDGINELETAVDLQPRHYSALRNLAVLYQRAGFRHKAIELWERALSAAPDEETRQGIKGHLVAML